MKRLVAQILVLALAVPAGAVTIVVDVSGGGDYLTIAEGVSNAATGDTVLVAPGTYQGYLNRDVSFAGKEIVLKAMPGSRDPVIMDAQLYGRCLLFENGEGRGAVVEGITMYRGSAGDGGGVQCYGAAPTFVDCRFLNCEASRGGGMNCAGGADPTLTGCEFQENFGSSAAGGLRCSSSTLQLTDCLFKANWSDRGGALFVRDGSSVSVTATEFLENTAEYSAGVRSEGSVLTIEDSAFRRNDAYSGGGIASGGGGMVTLRYCLFEWNTATFRGAGYACGTPATVEHCTFVGGVSPSGSSVFCGPPAGNADLTYCILSLGDGGAAMTCDPGGLPTVERCCVYGNTNDSLCGTYSQILYEDPMFCDVALHDFTIHADSPCMPPNNPWGEQIGAFGLGCSGGVPVQRGSWATIKAMYLK